MIKLAPVCPKCGKEAKRSDTKFGPKHSCCGLWSWDGKPLVDASTHSARKMAHAAFDGLWQSGRISRGEAYRMLAEELGIPVEECHMAQMDAEIAGAVPMAVRQIQAKLKRHPTSAPAAATLKVTVTQGQDMAKFFDTPPDTELFCLGDEVVCVDNTGLPQSVGLVLGDFYRIAGMMNDGTERIQLEEFGLDGPLFGAERFRLISANKREQRRAKQRLKVKHQARVQEKALYDHDPEFGAW